MQASTAVMVCRAFGPEARTPSKPPRSVGMKLLPFVPGRFAGHEWLALLVWSVLGLALSREPRVVKREATPATSLVAILWVLSPAQATTDSRLMSDGEYKAFLIQVEAKLAEWERALQSVDPAKTGMSYAVGERIVQYTNIGLSEVKNTETMSSRNAFTGCQRNWHCMDFCKQSLIACTTSSFWN